MLINIGMNSNDDGYIYFIDDDNTYDVRVFAEIRRIPISQARVETITMIFYL